MKKYSYILIVLFISACSSHRNLVKHSKNYIPLSNFKADTEAYLKANFLLQKDKYIGGKISALLKDLEAPVKSYLIVPAGKDTTFIGIELSELEFSALTKKTETQKPVTLIHILWKDPVSAKNIYDIVKKDRNNWTADDALIYGKQIIKDIDVSTYFKK